MVFYKNPPGTGTRIAGSKRLKSSVKFMSKNSIPGHDADPFKHRGIRIRVFCQSDVQEFHLWTRCRPLQTRGIRIRTLFCNYNYIYNNNCLHDSFKKHSRGEHATEIQIEVNYCAGWSWLIYFTMRNAALVISDWGRNEKIPLRLAS